MKTRITIFLIGAVFLLMSCEPEMDLYRHFVIRQGDHYATPRIVETLKSEKLSFVARFDQSCQYQFDDPSFQDSKNKLLGFADCNSMHHENSARFAWQWLHNRLEIFAYCYVNGERVEQFLGVVALEEENHFEIRLRQDEYVFTLNHQQPISIKRESACQTGAYYMLWPYFGGTLPAPHDVHVSIKMTY
jgi:hypothetical protein